MSIVKTVVRSAVDHFVITATVVGVLTALVVGYAWFVGVEPATSATAVLDAVVVGFATGFVSAVAVIHDLMLSDPGRR